MDSKQGASQLQCPICINHFQEPKFIHCLHIFCLACLRKLKDDQDDSIVCPVCNHKTHVKDVADLPTNFSLKAQVEEDAIWQQILASGQGSEINCQTCEEDIKADSRCLDCNCFVCEECRKAHKRLTMMKSHKIYTLDKFRSGEIFFKSNKADYIPKCKEHPEQNLCMYCSKCDVLVCVTCSILSHNSLSGHSLLDLSEALNQCKQDVEEKTDIAGKILQTFVAAVSAGNESIAKLNKKFQAVNEKISTKAQHEITKIKLEEEALKCELKKHIRARIKTLEAAKSVNEREMTKTEKKLDQVNQLMTQASSCQILGLKQPILGNLNELICTEKQPVILPDKLLFMEFKEGCERGIGKLVMEPKNTQVKEAQPVTETKTRPESKNVAVAFQKVSKSVSEQGEVEEKPNVYELSASKKIEHDGNCEEPISCTKLVEDIQTMQHTSFLSISLRSINHEELYEKPKFVQKQRSKVAANTLSGEGDDYKKNTAEIQPQGTEKLNAVCQKEEWQFKIKLKDFGSNHTKIKRAYSVAAYSGKKLIVADTYQKCLIRFCLPNNPESPITSQALEIPNLFNPRYISVNSCNNLVVLDGCKVKTFNEKFKIVHQFEVGTQKIYPTCLAVDEDDQIAVGYKNGQQVSLHKSDGSWTRIVHAEMIDSHLTTYKQRLVYTNYWNKMLFSIDYDGCTIFSASIPKGSRFFWGPNGVCCDKNGRIYVAVRAYGPATDIHQFTLDGVYIGCAIFGCDIPWGIALTPDNKDLVVATEFSVSIFTRK